MVSSAIVAMRSVRDCTYPEANWDRNFPSKAFALASLQKTKPTPAELEYGWILRKAGGELPLQTLVDLTRKTQYPCNFKPNYLKKKHTLFAEKNGIVSLAAPTALTLTQAETRKASQDSCPIEYRVLTAGG